MFLLRMVILVIKRFPTIFVIIQLRTFTDVIQDYKIYNRITVIQTSSSSLLKKVEPKQIHQLKYLGSLIVFQFQHESLSQTGLKSLVLFKS